MSIAIDKSVAIDMSRILMLESELSELRLLINTRVLDKTEESSMTERDQADNFFMTICSIFLSLLAVRRVWAVRIIQEGKLECFCLSNNINHVNKQWVPDETEESSMTGRDEIELAVPFFTSYFLSLTVRIHCCWRFISMMSVGFRCQANLYL